MELVQGVPITEYCDQCNLPTRERLELFVTVCQAVQHAHQKGVIHRDIKPTNVLVAIQDGQPAPKIIDFGVAKAIGQQLTEHTLMTAFAQIVGTPLYMSPEQAELSPLGVDTRSDIYSLGVLLYELLTGSTPLDKDRLHAASYDELRRIIREEEPPRPSGRLSSLALRERAGVRETTNQATTIAEKRRTDSRRLIQSIRGELDWIVMKCLEKDRNRRYESAGSLGRDVERYLNDEPVQACPPSAAYRLRKFIRRNKIAAAFVLLLVAATTALALSNVQTRLSERRAITENAKAQAVSNLLQGMLRSANPDEMKDADYTVRQLLDDFSASFAAGLPDQPEVEAEIRATIGRAYWRLGAADKAEPHLTKALKLRRRIYGPDDERVAEILVDMAWWHNEKMRYSDAEHAAREALRIYRNRGVAGSPHLKASAVLQRILIASGRLDEAEAVAEEALALASDTRTEYPEVAVILQAQADLLVHRGQYREAELVARRAVDMHRRLHGPAHPETAWGLFSLGDSLLWQRKLPQAEQTFREALSIFRQRYRGNHHSLTDTLSSLRQVLQAQGNQAALEALAREELLLSDPNRSGIWFHLANGFTKLGELQWRSGNPQDAEAAFRRAREIYSEHAAEIMSEPMSDYVADIGADCFRIASYLITDERQVEAVHFLSSVSRSAQELTVPDILANALYFIALSQARVGDKAGYRATCKVLIGVPLDKLNGSLKARPIWTPCIAPGALDDPTLPVKLAEQMVENHSLKDSHWELYLLGAAHYRAGEYEQAVQPLQESIAAYPSRTTKSNSGINYPRLLLSMTKWCQGQQNEARQLLAETLPAVEEELQSPSSSWYRRATLELLRDEAIALIGLKEADEAVE
jgi:tetratricopeptide (TPR) repeat protein